MKHFNVVKFKKAVKFGYDLKEACEYASITEDQGQEMLKAYGLTIKKKVAKKKSVAKTED